LKFTNVEDAPKFDFDSDALTPGEKNVLEAVAKCLTTGPLKGKDVNLIGRADPRGETEYNMTLGAKRARQVHQFLAALGVPDTRPRGASSTRPARTRRAGGSTAAST
jgi:peptidoglycan-associated lipoprotein